MAPAAWHPAWESAQPDRFPSSTLRVTIKQPAAGLTLIDLAGDVDVATCSALDQPLERALDDETCHRMVIDLDHLAFFAACGVRCLLRAKAIAADRAVELSLVCSNSAAALPLDLTRAGEELTVLHDRPYES